MTTRKTGWRKVAAGVGFALITLTHASASPTAGAIPTPGNVRFVDHGGPVLHAAKIELVYWGKAWTASGTSYPTPEQITAAIGTLLAGPYLSGLAQYRGITPALLQGSTVITSSDPPAGFTPAQVRDFLNHQIDAGVAPQPDRDQQTLYILLLPASAYAAGDDPNLVGEHSYYERHGQRISYAWIDDTASLFTATKIITHELVEAVTDPQDGAVLGVAGTCSRAGWCEIADICPDPVIVDGVAAAPYWSNQASACIAPSRAGASAAPDASASRQLPCPLPGGTVTSRSSGERRDSSVRSSNAWLAVLRSPRHAVSRQHHIYGATRVSTTNDGCGALCACAADVATTVGWLALEIPVAKK